jgi:hypothetical protein
MWSSVQLFELAPGLKDLLINGRFSTVDSIVSSSLSEIATVLRIDPYVAKIIFTEAKRFCKEKTVMAKATMITTSAPLI